MMARLQSLFRSDRRQALKLFGGAGLAALLLSLGAGLGAVGPLVSPAMAQEAVFEGRDKWLFPGWEKIDGVDKAAIDRTVNLIAFIRDELAKRKIDLVVAVAPAKAVVHRDKLPEGRTLSPDILGLYAAIQKDLAAKSVVSVDLAAALSGLPKDQQAFFRTDFHWTAWSSEASAKVTADAIKAKWTLTGNAGDGAKLGEWTKERRFGDLASKFLTPDQRKAIGREVFTVRGLEPAAGGSLIDDAAAPVHVVGNSFTAPYLGFSQALSHDLDRRVTLTWNPGDVGPWVTLLQYLQSDDFRSNPPQVVVWQFNEGQMQQSPSAEGRWDAASIMPDAEWQKQVRSALEK